MRQHWERKVPDYQASIACLQRALQIKPDEPGLWYTLGCGYELLGGHWYGAVNAFNHCVFFNPLHEVGWFSLSQLWAARGWMGKAAECMHYCDLIESLLERRRERGRPILPESPEDQ